MQLAPELGARWLSCDVKHNGTWTPLLWKAPSLAAARKNPFLYGLYLLAPWCNRIRNARFRAGKCRYRLKPNLSDGSAMHGDVYARAWTVRAHNATHFSATLDSRRYEDFNFPGELVFQLRIQLKRESLSLALTVRNVGKKKLPVGLGFHPFFVRPLRFKLPARARRVPSGPYPTGTTSTSSGFAHAWHDPATMEFDNSYCAFPSATPARMEIGTKRVPIALRWSNSVSDVFVYAPWRHEGRRANFACIEPMTMRPNAFAANDRATKRFLELKPGMRRTISMSLAYTPARR